MAGSGAALAQDLPAGGRQLSFGVNFGFDSNDNLGLDPVSLGTTNQFTTGLSFGALSQTENSLFQLDIGVELQWNDGPDFTQSGLDASLPDFALVWQRSGVNSAVDLTAAYAVSDLNNLRPVDDFDTGTGMRRDTDLAFSYTWGTAGPFQIGVDAGYSLNDYFDDPSADLVDSQDSSVGVNLGFDLNPVTTLTLGVSASVYEETEGSFDPEDTLGYSAGLQIDRPRGPITGDLFYDDTWEGDRYGISVGQDSEMKGGSLSYAIGATRTAILEEVVATGEIDYVYDLPNGSIAATASREVDYNSDNQESVTSGVFLTWSRQMTPLGTLNVNLSAASQEVLITGDTTVNTQAGVNWSQTIVQDWVLDLGYTYATRDETGLDNAQSNEVSLNLRKAFAIRP